MAPKRQPGPQRPVLPPVPQFQLTMPTGQRHSLREPPGFGEYPSRLDQRLKLLPMFLPRVVTIRLRSTTGLAPVGFAAIATEAEKQWLEFLAKQTPGPVPKPPLIRHIFVQVVGGTQGVFHFPSSQELGRSQDAALLGGVQVVLQVREDEQDGLELTFSAQGSWLFLLGDPNRNPSTEIGPANTGGQVQFGAQLAYVIDNLKGTKLQPVIVGQGTFALTRSYDPKTQTWSAGQQGGFALGAGMNYAINSRNTLGLGVTAGPTFNKDGLFWDVGAGLTWTGTIGDLLPFF